MPVYYTAWFCVECSKELTYEEVMHSQGRCPKCGFKHPNACTIVKTRELGYRLERVNPQWKPWKKQFNRVYVAGDRQ